MHVKKESLPSDISNQRYYYRYSWIHLTRPMTFTGTISPILAGTAFAAHHGQIRLDIFMAMITAALFIQAATNMFNDFFDFSHGQDEEKWILADYQDYHHRPAHHLIPYVAGSMLIVAAIIGAWLAYHSNLWIILIGTFGILAGYAYSAGSRSLSAVGLGETAAAIFLGIVPALLAYSVQGNLIDGEILLVALPFALLISTMILTNNLRDFEKDQDFRRTIVIRLGKMKATRLLNLLLILVYLLVIGLVLFQIVGATIGLVLFAFPAAIKLHWSFRYGASRSEEIAAMKLAAQHHWLFSLLFILGMLISL